MRETSWTSVCVGREGGREGGNEILSSFLLYLSLTCNILHAPYSHSVIYDEVLCIYQ